VRLVEMILFLMELVASVKFSTSFAGNIFVAYSCLLRFGLSGSVIFI
jgi:hypothetical protein